MDKPMDYSFIFEKEIPCNECNGTMLLQKNICNEYLYSCQSCRHYVYLKDEYLTDEDVSRVTIKKPIK